MASFAEDGRTSNWLQRMGVPFEYRVGLRYDQLKKDWSSFNHGRPDDRPKVDDLIERYADSMQSGAIFPAVIIACDKEGYEILDGCQRLCAAELNNQTIFNAYEIKTTDPSIRASVRICANAVTNGTAPPAEWTIGKVVDVLHDQFKWGVADCHLWSGFQEKKIEEEIAARDGRRWMQANGVDVGVKPANQKGFQAAFTRCVTPEMRQEASGIVVKIVEALQLAKANNSEAVQLLEECTDVKRKHGVNYRTQVKSKFDSVKERPEIAARLRPRSAAHPIDNAVRAIAGAVTSLKSAQNHHADLPQSAELIDLVREAKSLAKKIVPRENWAAPHDLFV